MSPSLEEYLVKLNGNIAKYRYDIEKEIKRIKDVVQLAEHDNCADIMTIANKHNDKVTELTSILSDLEFQKHEILKEHNLVPVDCREDERIDV
jgi:hypothetical protein